MVSSPPPPAALDELRRLSRQLGGDLMLTQGAGGNTSLKDDNNLWIKASGVSLAEAEQRNIFVAVDLVKTRANIAALKDDARDCTIGDGSLRPSIETSLHALMPQRVVLHLHATSVIAAAIRKDAKVFLQKKLNDLDWMFVPYVRPGLPLTLAIKDKVQQRAPDILVLGNHGLLVAGDNCADAKKTLDAVLTRLQTPIHSPPAPDLKKLQEIAYAGLYEVPDDALLHGIATDPLNLAIASKGVLYPDHAIFLGRNLTIVNSAQELKELKEKPPLIAVPNKGILLRQDSAVNTRAMVSCLALVLAQCEKKASFHYLDATALDELLNWDAEKYRQSLVAG